MQILYLDTLPLVKRYFEAAMPSEVYRLGLAEGNIAKQLDFEYKRLTVQWLKTTKPAIPRSVAKDVIGMERYPHTETLNPSPLLCGTLLTASAASLKGYITVRLPPDLADWPGMLKEDSPGKKGALNYRITS
jgi:hypothetical protein